MSHALLLRLFLSPSFFTVHVALQYLKLYSDNIGITYYLTRRLRELDTQELRDVWGFICHLLITRPSKSRALECFVVEIAQRSTHIAMITLWFMQAALQDLAPTKHNTQSFVICQRVLHKCHEIIFGDLPPPATLPYAFLDLPFQTRFARKKVRANAEPALVGLGIVLAGAPAMPQLTQIMGEVAIEQGRAHNAGHEQPRAANDDEDAIAPGVMSTAPSTEVSDEDDLDDDSPADQSASVAAARPKLQHTRTATDAEAVSPPRIQAVSLTRRKTIGAAKTSPALPLHMRTPRKPRLSDDPLGQNDPQPLPTNAASSSPSISLTPKHMSMSGSDFLLQKYDLQAQSHLLRSYFCQSEVQFLLTLENISNRLLVVPRPARVSALRAELTALNHKLPAEVCMPMWCSSSDTPRQHHATTQPHHRIVRIPPGESVVLNSAERAPYLLLMEILNDDLDFDPANRANKEALDRIVKKENESKGGSRDLITFNATTASHRRTSVVEHDTGKSSEDDTLGTSSAISPTSPTSEPDEEVDLVEQIYGTGHSLREPIDLSESIMLPPAPKNKDLDRAAWSRSSSIPPSPLATGGSSFGGSPFMNSPLVTNGPTFPPSQDAILDAVKTSVISLDEYSERMRTAAVMLAQLNANLVRESVTPLPVNSSAPPAVQSSSSLSWIPGSSWLGSSSDQASAGGPLHPSLAGSGGSAAASSSRMRVQHSEAAAIRDRIMAEMLALEEERMKRMRENQGEGMMRVGDVNGGMKSEDEGIIRRELNRADPSAVVFSESWAAKKSRIRHGSPYGHLANWDCISVIVKTGGDLRQEQLAVQLIHEFERIWQEEKCGCWVRYFRILITGGTSGLVETITDAVSIHSIKKAEYARRLAEGRLGHVSLFDHFKATYGDPSSAKFARAQRNFARSLAGYSVVTFLLQIKDRHNGNILLDREGHLIHIDFGFMLSNSPGNIGFEAAPFKLPPEYIEVLGGVDAEPFKQFKLLFREGFEAARKHCDRLITLVELMQKDSALPCFAAFGDQTANQLRDRFQPALTHSLIGDYVNSLIDSSLGSNWTRLYDSYQYYSQSIL
ncbi:hypothetical protein HWV62_5851 [Athelia sp. TMB]|nr:hypothetical protein HWV62_5851 [Athelia sp. TMB]